MCFLLKMGVFHCYVNLPEGNRGSKWLDRSQQDPHPFSAGNM